MLQRQHRELAADELDFAKVAQRGQALASFRETRRWEFLSTVQSRYLAILDALGLWDQQTARLVAIERRECSSDKDILLVGTTDMNSATRHMLDQVADRVTALIHAPESLADRFDAHGCLVSGCLAGHADRPADRAGAASCKDRPNKPKRLSRPLPVTKGATVPTKLWSACWTNS